MKLSRDIVVQQNQPDSSLLVTQVLNRRLVTSAVASLRGADAGVSYREVVLVSGIFRPVQPVDAVLVAARRAVLDHLTDIKVTELVVVWLSHRW